jgi:threonine/homoserine/homoserine lactone efflux protein
VSTTTGLLESLVFGAVLGVSLAVPPGPMNAWIAALAVRSYRAGVLTGLGAMTADALLGTTVYVAERFVNLHEVVRFVYLLGAAVMGYIGARLLRRPAAAEPETADQRTYLRALGIGLSNPFQVIWWLTAGLAFAYLGGGVLLLGLFGAIVAWVFGFPWAIRAGARRHEAFVPAVRLVSAAILIAFAGYFVVLFVLG